MLGKGNGGALLSVRRHGGIQRDAVNPGGNLRFTPESRESAPKLVHDFLEKVLLILRRVSVHPAYLKNDPLVCPNRFKKNFLHKNQIFPNRLLGLGKTYARQDSFMD